MFSKVELAKKAEFLDRAKSAREERATEKLRYISATKIQARLLFGPLIVAPRWCNFVLSKYLDCKITDLSWSSSKIFF